MTDKWHCPYSNCPQSSTRHWNLKTHIDRTHNGVGSPIRKSQQYAPPNTTFARFNNYGRQNRKTLSILENRTTDLEPTNDRHEIILKFLELQKLFNTAAQNWPSKQVFVPNLSANQSHRDLTSNQTLIWRAQTLELFRALKRLPPEFLKKAVTTAGHANLISIPIFEPYQDFYQLTNQGTTESTIQLDVDDLSGHWLGRTIWLGMWKLERDQLSDFLHQKYYKNDAYKYQIICYILRRYFTDIENIIRYPTDLNDFSINNPFNDTDNESSIKKLFKIIDGFFDIISSLSTQLLKTRSMVHS